MVAAERRQSKHVIDIVWFMCSKSTDGHCTITECFRSLHSRAIVEVDGGGAGEGGWAASMWLAHRYASRERTGTCCLLRISNFRYWQPNEPGNSSLVVYLFAFLPFDVHSLSVVILQQSNGDVFVARREYSEADDGNIFRLCNLRDLFTSRKAHSVYCRARSVSHCPILFVYLSSRTSDLLRLSSRHVFLQFIILASFS